MQCEKKSIRVVPMRGYYSHLRVRDQPCRARARSRVRIPFGENFIERVMCTRCAERRASDVLRSRGKVVYIEALDSDA